MAAGEKTLSKPIPLKRCLAYCFYISYTRMKPENIKGTIDAVNAGLQGLCEDEDVSFVNNDPSFHLADGSINDG